MYTQFVPMRFGRPLRLALALAVIVAGLAPAATAHHTPATHAATAIEYGL